MLNITTELEGSEKRSEGAKKKRFLRLPVGKDKELDQQLAGGRTG